MVPSLTTNTTLTNDAQPFLAVPEHTFSMAATLFVDCTVLDALTTAWQVLNRVDQQTVITRANATQLVVAPFDLPVGSYEIRVDTTMQSADFDLTDKAVSVSGYVDIVHCSLNVSLSPYASDALAPYTTTDREGVTVTAPCEILDSVMSSWTRFCSLELRPGVLDSVLEFRTRFWSPGLGPLVWNSVLGLGLGSGVMDSDPES